MRFTLKDYQAEAVRDVLRNWSRPATCTTVTGPRLSSR